MTITERSVTHLVGMICTCVGAAISLGNLFVLVGGFNIFVLVIAGLTLAPWAVLAATLSLKPMSAGATLFATTSTVLLLFGTVAFFIETNSSIHDAQGGVLFLIAPAICLAIATTVFVLVWSAVRSERNRLASVQSVGAHAVHDAGA